MQIVCGREKRLVRKIYVFRCFDRILRGIMRSDGEDNLVPDEVREKRVSQGASTDWWRGRRGGG